MSLHRYNNWKKEPEDYRDKPYKALHLTSIPDRVDLREGCTPVENQGSLGSCTGNAIVGAMEYLDHVPDDVFVDLSRLYVYYNERFMEGTVNEDAGAYIRDGIKSLVRYGVCTEKLWPYDPAKFTFRPDPTCYRDGRTRRISSYYRLTSLNDMLQCLAVGFPFVFGFNVYESFESQSVALTGIVPMPVSGERQLGGHAVLAVGYDKVNRDLIVRNSWGAEWGDNGYFYLPFGFIEEGLADDFWTIRK